MHSRFIGGLLLIVGTSIGGGMLALPIANAAAGFWPSTLFLCLCWALMTCGAFFILEANLYLPPKKHMVSMAEATLGPIGLFIAWLSYLFLLYSLLAAYISGGSDMLSSLLSQIHISLVPWQSSLLFTLFFGLIVYGGIFWVDYANRLFMFGKLGVYCLLLILITPYIKTPQLNQGELPYISSSIMILITSFGFAIIVPNLRDYFDDNIPLLKKVIFIGSLIPLFCYIAWDAVIIGALPSAGENGLINLINHSHTTSELARLVESKIQNHTISYLFNFFTSICMLTAFLGVALCLYSFLADGLKLRSRGVHGIGLFFLTFAPPLLLVLYYPGAYMHALKYAGICCIILLLLLPALMCYFGRQKYHSPYWVPGSLYSQWTVIIVATGLIAFELWNILYAV
ncbi:MAG: tryptophan/tyrosine permease [Legionella sp.]|nr:MAG: tryptophan/tyrosine permease [Legionella sp.]PJD99845.1 MAG: tryptophan/tyrosine permease [Legionella sp.]